MFDLENVCTRLSHCLAAGRPSQLPAGHVVTVVHMLLVDTDEDVLWCVAGQYSLLVYILFL